MTGRSLIVSLTTTALIVGFGLGYSVAPAPKAMPAKVAARLVEHRILTVIDSQRVKQLEADNARLKKAGDAQLARARRSDSLATDAWTHADSIAVAARRAFTAVDSALLWEAAANAFKVSAEAAIEASKGKDSTRAVRDSQLVVKDGIISTVSTRAERADQRIAELEPLATGDDGCRIAKFFKCPSRKQSAVGGVVAAAVAVVLAKREL